MRIARRGASDAQRGLSPQVGWVWATTAAQFMAGQRSKVCSQRRTLRSTHPRGVFREEGGFRSLVAGDAPNQDIDEGLVDLTQEEIQPEGGMAWEEGAGLPPRGLALSLASEVSRYLL